MQRDRMASRAARLDSSLNEGMNFLKNATGRSTLKGWERKVPKADVGSIHLSTLQGRGEGTALLGRSPNAPRLTTSKFQGLCMHCSHSLTLTFHLPPPSHPSGLRRDATLLRKLTLIPRGGCLPLSSGFPKPLVLASSQPATRYCCHWYCNSISSATLETHGGLQSLLCSV